MNQTTTTPDKIAMNVFYTKDYTKFKHLDGNRNIVLPHLNRLKSSIEKKYLFSPILINEKHEIIDGQHRFEICKELGLPIYYIMKKGYSLNEVQILNSNLRNWSNEDYMNGYIELGLHDYELFKMFRQEFGFDHHASLWLLSGSLSGRDTWHDFKSGEFKIRDYKKAVKDAEKLKMIEKYYEGFSRRAFVSAMLKCFKNKEYNHSVFMSKLAYQSTKLVDCTNSTQYLTLIEEIYNFKSRDKRVNLRFAE